MTILPQRFVLLWSSITDEDTGLPAGVFARRLVAECRPSRLDLYFEEDTGDAIWRPLGLRCSFGREHPGGPPKALTTEEAELCEAISAGSITGHPAEFAVWGMCWCLWIIGMSDDSPLAKYLPSHAAFYRKTLTQPMWQDATIRDLARRNLARGLVPESDDGSPVVWRQPRE